MKVSKLAADYREPDEPRPLREKCERCTMFRPPENCTSVMGKVDPGAWCKLFKARGR